MTPAICPQVAPNGGVILSSEILQLAAGATVPADSYGLANKSDRGILIDRLIFSVRGSARDYLGNAITAKLRLGSYEITNGFVPLSVLNSPYSGRTRSNESYYYGSGGLIFTNVLPLMTPFYMPPGIGLSAEFSRNTDGTTDSVGISVGFAGRFTTDRQRVTQVPYISAFIHPRNILQSISKNTELQNPFNQNMFIDKFIGCGDDTSSGSGIAILDYALTGSTNLVELAFRGSTVLTSAPLPFNALFWPGQFVAEAKMWIGPRDWFISEFSNVSGNVQPVVAMIGYREEAF